MGWKVEFVKGDYSARERKANELKAVAYVEHHFNSLTPNANYTVVIGAHNASQTSKNMGMFYAQAIADEFIGRAQNIKVENAIYTEGAMKITQPIATENSFRFVYSQACAEKTAVVVEELKGGDFIVRRCGVEFRAITRAHAEQIRTDKKKYEANEADFKIYRTETSEALAKLKKNNASLTSDLTQMTKDRDDWKLQAEGNLKIANQGKKLIKGPPWLRGIITVFDNPVVKAVAVVVAATASVWNASK